MKKPLLILALLGTVSYGAYRMLGSSSEQPAVNHGEPLVLDRIWIDHIPKNDRDTIQVFAAISEEPFGLFQAASAWKGAYELFRYEAKGHVLRIVYPQKDRARGLGERADGPHRGRAPDVGALMAIDRGAHSAQPLP